MTPDTAPPAEAVRRRRPWLRPDRQVLESGATVGRLASVVLEIASAVVLVRVVGVAAYGELQAAVVAAALVFLVLDFGRTQSGLAEVSRTRSRPVYFANARSKWLIGTAACAAGAVAAHLQLPQAGAALLFLSCNVGLIRWAAMATGRPLAIFWSYAARPAGTLVAALLVWLLPDLHRPDAVLLVIPLFAALSSGLVSVLDRLLAGHFTPTTPEGWTRTSRRERTSLTLVSLAYQAYGTGDLLMVRLLAGASAAGLYAVAYRPAQGFLLLLVFLRDKWIVQHSSPARKTLPRPEIFRRAGVAMAATAPVCAALVAFQPLSTVFASPADTDLVASVLLLSLTPVAVGFYVLSLLIAQGNSAHVVGPAYACLLVSIAVNLALIPALGAVGAALTTLIVESISAGILLWRHYPREVAGPDE
jgi:stage V sporulation protein B